MNPTETIRNFHGLLDAAIPFFTRTGLTDGSDEWDNFLEAAFQAFVCTPFEYGQKGKIAWRYGDWREVRPGEFFVGAIATPGSEIFVGWPWPNQRNPRGQNFQYRKQIVSESPLEFVFREFGSPFKGPDDLKEAGGVMGVVDVASRQFPCDCRIYANLDSCNFAVTRKPEQTLGK